MSGTTISNSVSIEVSLGIGVYLSPFTITSAGKIISGPATSSQQSASSLFADSEQDGASVVNFGTIEGKIPTVDSFTVPAFLAASAVNTENYGVISGQSGVYLNNGGVLTNSGTIRGEDARTKGGYGVLLTDASLTNSGNVYGARYGVAIADSGEVANSGTILGTEDGVHLVASYAGGGSLYNAGTIYGTKVGVAAVNATILNDGNISGKTYGAQAVYSVFINDGEISGTRYGVDLLTENSSPTLSSFLQNYGSIEGVTVGLGVSYADGASYGYIFGGKVGAVIGKYGYLQNSGNIYGGSLGAQVDNDGLLINLGTIKGSTIGGWIDGGNLLNASTGYVTGTTIGLKQQGYSNNTGTIAGGKYGLQLLSGNAISSGYILSEGVGVILSTSASDFLNNSGTVYGKTSGIDLDTGSVYNSGTIVGGSIGIMLTTSTTLVNFGSVYGKKYGIQFVGGSADNYGTITGQTFGVKLSHGTLTNSGTISGSVDAIYGQSFSLLLEAGAAFSGDVVSKTNVSTLELAGVKAWTLTGIGTSFVGFSDIVFEPGALWSVSGNTAGLAAQQTIAGFGQGDTIVLNGFSASSESFATGKGLELFGTKTVTLDLIGGFATADFAVSSTSLATTVSLQANAPCFVLGTRMLTANGEVPIEKLAVGEKLIVRTGSEEPIIWIGKRTLDLRRHPRPSDAQPICLKSSSIAENVPSRDLWVSPDHAIHFDGNLIPARLLLNDCNVCQAARENVTYYHVELAHHSVIFAENTAVESYLETGNRPAFDNGGVALVLHPDFSTLAREKNSCATLVTSGEILESIRKKIMNRFHSHLLKAS